MASRSSPSHGNSSEEAMDKQNTLSSEYLSQKVSTLKSLAFDIEDHAKEHNRLLDSMDDDFDASKGFLSGSMHRVNVMIGRGRNNRKMMCYVSLFLVAIFVIAYYLLGRVF